MKTKKTRTLRCRINEIFTDTQLKKIERICDSKRIRDNNEKVDVLRKLLDSFEIDYTPLAPGTNRYAILIDGVVYKFALDSWGKRDNLNEFCMTNELQPYVIKVYECTASGVLMTCEYVTVIDKDEYLKNKEAILDILAELSESYLLGDVGYISKNYMNWGYTDDNRLVILDFAYIYKVVGQELLCNDEDCRTHPPLMYNDTFSELYCPECGKKYSFIDIRIRYSKQDEEKLVNLQKELSYKTTEKKLVIEDAHEEDEETDEEVSEIVQSIIDNDDEYIDVTYGDITNDEVIQNFELDHQTIENELESPYYRYEKDTNIFNPEVIKKLKEDYTMSEFMKELAKYYAEANGTLNTPYGKVKPSPKREKDEDDEDIVMGETMTEEEAMAAYDALIESSFNVPEEPEKPVKEQPQQKKPQNKQKQFNNQKQQNRQPDKKRRFKPIDEATAQKAVQNMDKTDFKPVEKTPEKPVEKPEVKQPKEVEPEQETISPVTEESKHQIVSQDDFTAEIESAIGEIVDEAVEETVDEILSEKPETTEPEPNEGDDNVNSNQQDVLNALTAGATATNVEPAKEETPTDSAKVEAGESAKVEPEKVSYTFTPAKKKPAQDPNSIESLIENNRRG